MMMMMMIDDGVVGVRCGEGASSGGGVGETDWEVARRQHRSWGFDHFQCHAAAC